MVRNLELISDAIGRQDLLYFFKKITQPTLRTTQDGSLSGRRKVDSGVDTLVQARCGPSLQWGGERCLDYEYSLEAEAVKFGADLDVGVRERKESIMTPKLS